MTLSELVKNEMLRQRKSYSKMSELAGISKAHLWDIGRGASKNLRVDTICRLAMALNLNPEVVFRAVKFDWEKSTDVETMTVKIPARKRYSAV